jgi:hypothetical protein
MNDADRSAILDRLRGFVTQQHDADELADQNSLDRAADLMALYDERDERGRRRWATEIEPPRTRRTRGRPVDPESFSRFTRWLGERVPLRGSTAYRLRDAHDIATNYFARGEIKPTGERVLRPLKWLTKNGYEDRVGEVWKEAVKLAGGGSPDSPTVRKALAAWKHDNLPRTPRATTPAARTGTALVKKWLDDWHRIMEQYPELCIDAINRAEAEAERYFTPKKKAAAV